MFQDKSLPKENVSVKTFVGTFLKRKLSERKTDRKEEEDDGEERQPQPLLQRVLRFHGRSK